MPRQGVPYGGAICRLKERIAEIWDKLGEKLHSINGVEGDGAGDVKIVSGDAAVVINNDQIGHKIEVGLDKSKLPEISITPDPYKGIKRDAQGRAFAADPIAGATDKTLVTANWVSQTGDGAPNNLIHKTGNETKIGTFEASVLMANQTVRAVNSIVIKDSYLASNTSIPTNTNDAAIAVIAQDNSEIMNFIVRTDVNGWRALRIGLHDTATGANHLFNLITISPDGTVTYPWS